MKGLVSLSIKRTINNLTFDWNRQQEKEILFGKSTLLLWRWDPYTKPPGPATQMAVCSGRMDDQQDLLLWGLIASISNKYISQRRVMPASSVFHFALSKGTTELGLSRLSVSHAHLRRPHLREPRLVLWDGVSGPHVLSTARVTTLSGIRACHA